MTTFKAGIDGVTFFSHGSKLLGVLYRAAGESPRPSAVLIHGTPGIEKHLDIAYRLRDLGWNCLAFHFRGCWGSDGSFSFTGLAEDTAAAVAWLRQQPSVDPQRIALIGGAMGGHAALLYAARDPAIRAVVAMCPLIDPQKFALPETMAHEFAELLNGVRPRDLLEQWTHVGALNAGALHARDILLVTTDADELFPPSHYEPFAAQLPRLEWRRAQQGDHAFSTCRPWLVSTVTEWLVETVACGRLQLSTAPSPPHHRTPHPSPRSCCPT